ncbi:hypothetical protein MTO96_018224 [Rhipicephalus appendiculatus]
MPYVNIWLPGFISNDAVFAHIVLPQLVVAVFCLAVSAAQAILLKALGAGALGFAAGSLLGGALSRGGGGGGYYPYPYGRGFGGGGGFGFGGRGFGGGFGFSG